MNPSIKKLDILINNERSANNFNNYNLNDIKKLLAIFGNPHKKIKTIHIAGTNGKGSVAHMLNSIFIASGKKAGLYTSPHLIRITERIKINDKEIPADVLSKYADELFAVLDKNTKLRPTYFDALTLIAFRYFCEEKTDIAIIETGLGGRLDSTNVIHPGVSVITDIALDHMHILGKTIQKIAAEKAGIIKRNSFVVTSNRDKRIQKILLKKSKEMHSELYIMSKDFGTENAEISPDKIKFDFSIKWKNKKSMQDIRAIKNIGLRVPGAFQIANASLTVTASLLLRKSGIVITERDIRKGLLAVKIPGRFEMLCRRPLIVFDPAHNPAALKATLEALKARYPRKKYSALVSFMTDKDFTSMFNILRKNFTKNIIYYELNDSRCLKIQGNNSSGIKSIRRGIIPVNNFKDLKKAVSASFESDSLLFITGTFRLYPVARKLCRS